LLHAIYVDNQLLLPAGTVVAGSVVALLPDHSRRVHAILGGDFTPFRIPEVHFDHIVLADGQSVALLTGPAVSGAPLYHAVATPPVQGGFLKREWEGGLDAARGDLATFIGPDKGDRLLQFIYSQIPYHPQRIEKGTAWTVETTAVTDVPAQPAAPAPPTPPLKKVHFWDVQRPAPRKPEDIGAWIVQANLSETISSETSTKGEAIKATVAQPIYNADHSIAVPEGAMLIGTVNNVKPARKFGRTGVLSFSFTQLVLPNQQKQIVETRLTGADAAADIALNSEGQAKSKPQDKLAIPLILLEMANRPLDRDGGRAHDTVAKGGVAGAAGLGLIGTVVGLAGASPYVSAGIGYWGAARSIFGRWIATGQKVTFAKDTRIVVETTPRHAAPMKSGSQSSQ
jgi:hypothetical protein